ncbi:MAG: hypothetical protein IH614_07460 [Desulfuromonadales bacterium]|nr:hypothetical protein [Desulfuromonadales bacterium]
MQKDRWDHLAGSSSCTPCRGGAVTGCLLLTLVLGLAPWVEGGSDEAEIHALRQRISAIQSHQNLLRQAQPLSPSPPAPTVSGKSAETAEPPAPLAHSPGRQLLPYPDLTLTLSDLLGRYRDLEQQNRHMDSSLVMVTRQARAAGALALLGWFLAVLSLAGLWRITRRCRSIQAERACFRVAGENREETPEPGPDQGEVVTRRAVVRRYEDVPPGAMHRTISKERTKRCW